MSRTAMPSPTTPSAPEFPGATPGDDALLRHVVSTGSMWFAAALIGCSLPLTGLLAAGWRPSHLGPAAAVLWWCAAGVSAAGVVALALAGCPVIGGDAGPSARRKSFSIRVGVVLVLVGGGGSLLAVLAG